VRELNARLSRLGDEHRTLTERRQKLIEVTLTPHIRVIDTRKRERDAFDTRYTEALQMAKLLKDKVLHLDEEIVAIEKEQRDIGRTLEAAKLEDRQASMRERLGTDQPSRTITTRLVGEGRSGRLLVTYAVQAARWWPTYTLR